MAQKTYDIKLNLIPENAPGTEVAEETAENLKGGRSSVIKKKEDNAKGIISNI